MNLNTINHAPFVQGIIHIKSTTEANGEIQTTDQFEILDRYHGEKVPDMLTGGINLPSYAQHPIGDKISKLNGNDAGIRAIPIRMFFNKADASVQIGFRAYSTETGQPICSGDGKTAMRALVSGDGTQTQSEHPCPGCDACPFADQVEVACYRQVKMAVQIDGQGDDLSVFEVRSTSINSYKTLYAQLRQIEMRLGGLRHVPLMLKLWKSSNALSDYDAFHCMRPEFNASNEIEAFKVAKRQRDELSEVGIQDNNDEVFAVQNTLASYFDAVDSYALDRGLGSHSGRRSGAISVTGALMRKMKRSDSSGQGAPFGASSIEDFLASAPITLAEAQL